ncbi:class A beta-lactamase-related serine hydrolase [Sporolactobacillus shoreicorticis]|uniref:Serine hydrolase n=1 Tax=Sporolactobacillus shoreicorticis TaxID=1923877 RepID=A0ABW5S7X2_9BACL|nr:serine hydrolase [Sporolactobacillus shoreicorticis]MCO7125707.1 class A beta-lactamase-related serine hydrolase [Sporolactobacillus shoreicorticis]
MTDASTELRKVFRSVTNEFRDHIAVEAIGSDGASFGYNENIPMLSASLIKLPILFYAFKNPHLNPSQLQQTVRFDEEQIVGGSGVLQLLSGREWMVKDLLGLMISVSDNTATNLIMDFFGIDQIQKWVADQGLTETKIERKMMDEDAQRKGRTNRISAHDANSVIRHIFSKTDPFPDEVKFWMLHQQFRDKLPGLFDEKTQPVSVYNKTGEMEEIDHDAAYFTCNGHSMAVTVMTSGIKNRQKALMAIQNIGDAIANYLIQQSEKNE